MKNAPRNTNAMTRNDASANEGVRTRKCCTDILGPRVVKSRNINGKTLMQILSSFHLMVISTFFWHETCTTWKIFSKMQAHHALDTFSASKNLLKKVLDFRVVDDGARSDHSVGQLEISMASKKCNNEKK